MKKILIRAGLGLAGLFAALILGGAVYRPRPNIPAGFDGAIVRLPSGSVRVKQKGTGPDLLLIHGCPGSVEDWDPIFDKLAERYQVTAYDRPDNGFSVAQDNEYTLAYNARVARELIDQLGLEKPLLVGHSYGGATALWMLVKENADLRGFVLLGAPAYGPVDLDSIIRLTAVRGLGQGLSAALSPLIGPSVVKAGLLHSFGPNKEIVDDAFVRSRVRLMTHRRVPYTRARELVLLEDSLRAMMPLYRNLHRKIYIVQGREDVVAQSAWKLHWEIPESELLVLEGVGHYPQYGRPDAVIAVIDRAMNTPSGRKGT